MEAFSLPAAIAWVPRLLAQQASLRDLEVGPAWSRPALWQALIEP